MTDQKGTTTFTKITELSNGKEWPDGVTNIVWAVGGQLAHDIRCAAKAAADTVVIIEEVQTDGGYSEYTQETDYDFTLRVGGEEIDLGEGRFGVEDYCWYTKIGRLDKWLRDSGDSDD
jgi:D-serine deaminase-like pyridoxal phosphate-dependent protein